MQRRIHQSIPEQGKWLRQVLTGFFFAQLPLIDPYDRKVFCGRRAPNVRSKSQTKKGVRLRERGEDAKLIVRSSREDSEWKGATVPEARERGHGDDDGAERVQSGWPSQPGARRGL